MHHISTTTKGFPNQPDVRIIKYPHPMVLIWCNIVMA